MPRRIMIPVRFLQRIYGTAEGVIDIVHRLVLQISVHGAVHAGALHSKGMRNLRRALDHQGQRSAERETGNDADRDAELNERAMLSRHDREQLVVDRLADRVGEGREVVTHGSVLRCPAVAGPRGRA